MVAPWVPRPCVDTHARTHAALALGMMTITLWYSKRVVGLMETTMGVAVFLITLTITT
jgi:hypothetical protein